MRICGFTYDHVVPKAVQRSGSISQLTRERVVDQFAPCSCRFVEKVLNIIMIIVFYAHTEWDNPLFDSVDIRRSQLK